MNCVLYNIIYFDEYFIKKKEQYICIYRRAIEPYTKLSRSLLDLSSLSFGGCPRILLRFNIFAIVL